MKLISLIDNTAVDDKLFSENGMSFFVEFGGKNYIIDTGLTGKAAENARRMQLPTDELDAVVLTHNHAAHVGGIDSFMRLSPDAEIYLRAGAQTERFRKTGFFKEPVGEWPPLTPCGRQRGRHWNRICEAARIPLGIWWSGWSSRVL